ncbi:uncharacterized protein LOC126846574 [Adelges cooleyi]|uniref:uncharacterized protein LOC126846574 n=1 Tax=Adelges cooleyi TaxID=133065 RepID=UPI0021809AF3|nr:uncharacterized protein LOC126846574 [Adelges cooleyi]
MDGIADRRVVRHHGKHHKMAPPDRWPSGAADQQQNAVHHRQTVFSAANNSVANSGHLQSTPASMCYTTNEVLVIIAVTCFLNFAFILLIMTCVHCFTDPSYHKKFGAVTYTELQGDDPFDSELIDGDAITLLNPTKSRDYRNSVAEPYENKLCDLTEYVHRIESCAALPAGPKNDRRFRSGQQQQLSRSRKNSEEEDLLLFE